MSEIMMDLFQKFDVKHKEKIVSSWKGMSETDKTHFINQVSICLSVWGSDELGKQIVVDVLGRLVSNGSTSLSDFGLYAEASLENSMFAIRSEKIRRASLIVEGYRIKTGLRPSRTRN